MLQLEKAQTRRKDCAAFVEWICSSLYKDILALYWLSAKSTRLHEDVSEWFMEAVLKTVDASAPQVRILPSSPTSMAVERGKTHSFGSGVPMWDAYH